MKDTHSDHGHAIEEILSKKPPFTVRWGTLGLFFLLIVIILICGYIKYPDKVQGRARLNTVNAPKQVISRTDGKLIKMAVKENEQVMRGQILGYMESIANPQSVAEISRQINAIDSLIEQDRADEILSFFPGTANFPPISDLGELQTSYQTFVASFITFRDFLSDGFVLRKKNMLLADLKNLQKLHETAAHQKELMQQDLSLSNETFSANESLVKDKVISHLEYRNEKSKLISKQLSLPQINASIISNESLQNEKRKEIIELENQFAGQKNTFIQVLQTLNSQVQEWELKYVLKAPVSGIVSFIGFLQENQEMKTGQPLFYVQPDNSFYFAEVVIPQYNFGKVKLGQQVLLKFQAYPFEQYGSVAGKIDYISNSAGDSGFLAKVILPNGLITNYRKSLQYSYGLRADVDIITENRMLLERFYSNIVK